MAEWQEKKEVSVPIFKLSLEGDHFGGRREVNCEGTPSFWATTKKIVVKSEGVCTPSAKDFKEGELFASFERQGERAKKGWFRGLLGKLKINKGQ